MKHRSHIEISNSKYIVLARIKRHDQTNLSSIYKKYRSCFWKDHRGIHHLEMRWNIKGALRYPERATFRHQSGSITSMKVWLKKTYDLKIWILHMKIIILRINHKVECSKETGKICITLLNIYTQHAIVTWPCSWR